MHQTSKKLVLILATSMPVTETSIEDIVVLNQVSCIYYLIWFKKNKIQVQALINFNSKINAIISGYASKLGLKVCFTNVEAYKINDSIFKTFRIVLASF